ncbi:MAG: hypothetical protein SF053_15875 [Bacteroidia bacterium]|nr:hypothetical protein [Bacteroidia bacterium]
MLMPEAHTPKGILRPAWLIYPDACFRHEIVLTATPLMLMGYVWYNGIRQEAVSVSGYIGSGEWVMIMDRCLYRWRVMRLTEVQ